MRGAALTTIAVAAGGTGGHLFPAAATAAALREAGAHVVLLTDARTAERAATAFPGIEIEVIPGAGIAGRGVIRGTTAMLGMARGTLVARVRMKARNVRAVVAFGGYPSVPPVLAARSLGLRIVLHEANGVLGRANRALARFADLVALALPGTERVPPGVATERVGTPVRESVLRAVTPYAPPCDEFRLLVLGGSLGARALATTVPAALAALAPASRGRIRLTLQARADDLDAARAALAAAGIEAEIAPFFPDVAERYAAAHLVIARAGASTVAELAAVGRPSLLVPLPNAIDDHQSANARRLSEAGAGWLVPQDRFTADTLAERLASLLADPGPLLRMAAQAASLAQPEAAQALALRSLALVTQGARP